ncbi:MAG: hypothetical protein H5T50_04985 [Nitrososphaeria archaeon]|nr:hypothetical protein [Nitrososphaeria archaeon]
MGAGTTSNNKTPVSGSPDPVQQTVGDCNNCTAENANILFVSGKRMIDGTNSGQGNHPSLDQLKQEIEFYERLREFCKKNWEKSDKEIVEKILSLQETYETVLKAKEAEKKNGKNKIEYKEKDDNTSNCRIKNYYSKRMHFMLPKPGDKQRPYYWLDRQLRNAQQEGNISDLHIEVRDDKVTYDFTLENPTMWKKILGWFKWTKKTVTNNENTQGGD